MQAIIYDSVSRAILVVHPQLNAQGTPLLPAGLPTAAIANISDTEVAKFSTAGSNFSLAADGQTVVVTPVPVDPVLAASQSQLVALLGPLVGRSAASLTQAERLQIIVGLAVAIGALDRQTLTVQPLSAWLR